MKAVFYITNHGYGHASRNVPIIQELFKRDLKWEVVIKSDSERCDFLKRNLINNHRVRCYSDCSEPGLIMKSGRAEPDLSQMHEVILSDIRKWNSLIEREKTFLNREKPDIVICDIVGWAIKAAKECNLPVILIGNFTWESMYRSFYENDIWEPYHDCYMLADKAVWYTIHSAELYNCNTNYECVSLISRNTNKEEIEIIRKKYGRHIVFVSLGASVDLKRNIDVQGLPYVFLTTRGIRLKGENVIELPLDMTNTPDYIAASEIVVAKGGWSTVAEILLQRKKCALLLRGDNSEDNYTKEFLGSRGQCVPFSEKELMNMGSLLDRVKALCPQPYNDYYDDRVKICDIIYDLIERRQA